MNASHDDSLFIANEPALAREEPIAPPDVGAPVAAPGAAPRDAAAPIAAMPTSAAPSPQTAGPPPLAPDTLAALARIDARLEQIRQLLDSDARESQHQEFSLARLFGSIAQALVVGLLGAAAFDWIFDGTFEQIITKLAFAAVLQVAALSAFILTRRPT